MPNLDNAWANVEALCKKAGATLLHCDGTLPGAPDLWAFKVRDSSGRTRDVVSTGYPLAYVKREGLRFFIDGSSWEWRWAVTLLSRQP